MADEHSSGAEKVAVITAVGVTTKAFLLPQIVAMREQGLEPFAVCSPGEDVEALRKTGLRVVTIAIPRSVNPLTDLLALWKLWRLFRTEKPRIVHTHTPKAAFLGQLSAWLARVPIRINTVHGLFYIGQRGIKRALFKQLEILACRLATFVFCVSAEDVPVLRKYVAADRIESTGNGIDLSRFNPAVFSEDDRRKIRDEFQIPQSAFVVGVVARMVNEKGLRELMQAVAKVRESNSDVWLLHVGPVDRSRGDELTPDYADALGIASTSRFLGARNDVNRIMTVMDIFCLPSYREGYPVSVIEAAAMGLPVITTNIRGCREAVIDGVTGLLVPVKEVEPLVAAITRLHDDLPLREHLAAGARTRAEECFDERRVVKQIMVVYQRLRSTK
jgi:glycosyltransferase involved in cell wall biosynthesis